MNTRTLKLALKDELQTLFTKVDYPVKMPKAVYVDTLPKKKYEDENSMFPFALILSEEEELYINPSDGNNTSKINICFGSNYEDKDTATVESLIDKTYHYLAEHIIGGYFEAMDSISVKYGEDEYQPFVYGCMTVNFKMPELQMNGTNDIEI